MGEIQDRLKELRKALGLKQREVAEKVGVKVNVVGNWESGRPVPATRIYQLCKEYNVRRKWLESGEGEMFESPAPEISESSVKRELFERMFDKLTTDELEAIKNLANERLEAKKE